MCSLLRVLSLFAALDLCARGAPVSLCRFLLFEFCFTNHMTLVVAAMGIEVLVAAAHPKLGRDLFLANSVAGLID